MKHQLSFHATGMRYKETAKETDGGVWMGSWMFIHPSDRPAETEHPGRIAEGEKSMYHFLVLPREHDILISIYCKRVLIIKLHASS